jgi:acetylornithine deacetylase/succinyl-diaminopimelate desuccinylase-like protein
MSDVARMIHAFLASRREEQDRFLAELVKVPSDNPPGDCAPHAKRAAELLEALGFVVERHVVPDAAVSANGMVSCTNLVVRVRFGMGTGPVIALNAHGDVVAPGAGWTTDPYGAEIRDGFMYGRGAAVSKSDFATYTYALLALRDAAAGGAALAGAVELHFTYDEEVGGAIGPQWLLQQKICAPDYAISAGFSYGITTAHNGCLHLQVDVAGKSGHAAEPEKGIDALEAATGILSDLYALRQSYSARRSTVPGIGSPTLVVGLIAGGINTNVVPDHVTFRIDRRIIPEEVPAEVEATLTRHIHDFAAKWPALRVCVKRILLAVPFVPIPGQEKLVAALQRHGKAVLGEEIGTHGVPIYTDARLYTTAGIPAVLYGAGPRTLGEANGHRADEKLRLDDLHLATEVVALTLADLLSPQPP